MVGDAPERNRKGKYCSNNVLQLKGVRNAKKRVTKTREGIFTSKGTNAISLKKQRGLREISLFGERSMPSRAQFSSGFPGWLWLGLVLVVGSRGSAGDWRDRGWGSRDEQPQKKKKKQNKHNTGNL